MPLFIISYLAVIEIVKLVLRPLMMKHLKDLMVHAELYGWEPVRTFHAIWLRQLDGEETSDVGGH